MLIDWFTVGAQIVNFLILVALLKRFLYAPIIRAMERREAHIASQLQAAQEKEAAAAQQAAYYHEQIDTLQRTRETLLTQADNDAEAQRQRLYEQARQDVQQLQERWQQALQQEQQAFLWELRQHAGLQVCSVARQALGDLANIPLEQAVTDVFLRRLQQISTPELQALQQGVQASPQPLVVRSAFDLPEALRQRICAAVHRHIAEQAQVHFESRPELMCGVELEADGCRLSWNLDAYLEALEEHFRTVLAEAVSATATPTATGSRSC